MKSLLSLQQTHILRTYVTCTLCTTHSLLTAKTLQVRCTISFSSWSIIVLYIVLFCMICGFDEKQNDMVHPPRVDFDIGKGGPYILCVNITAYMHARMCTYVSMFTRMCALSSTHSASTADLSVSGLVNMRRSDQSMCTRVCMCLHILICADVCTYVCKCLYVFVHASKSRKHLVHTLAFMYVACTLLYTRAEFLVKGGSSCGQK